MNNITEKGLKWFWNLENDSNFLTNATTRKFLYFADSDWFRFSWESDWIPGGGTSTCYLHLQYIHHEVEVEIAGGDSFLAPRRTFSFCTSRICFLVTSFTLPHT